VGGQSRFDCASQTAIKEKGHQAISVSLEILCTKNIKARLLPEAAEPPQASALAQARATARPAPSQHPRVLPQR